MFGVVEGPESEVELLILNAETEAYLRQRTVHPSQRITRRSDGRAVLTLKVRGTVELANWIMSMSPWVEVLRPAELRAEIAERIASAARRYGATRRDAARSSSGRDEPTDHAARA